MVLNNDIKGLIHQFRGKTNSYEAFDIVNRALVAQGRNPVWLTNCYTQQDTHYYHLRGGQFLWYDSEDDEWELYQTQAMNNIIATS